MSAERSKFPGSRFPGLPHPTVVLAPYIAEAARWPGVAGFIRRCCPGHPDFLQELDRMRREACECARKRVRTLVPVCWLEVAAA